MSATTSSSDNARRNRYLEDLARKLQDELEGARSAERHAGRNAALLQKRLHALAVEKGAIHTSLRAQTESVAHLKECQSVLEEQKRTIAARLEKSERQLGLAREETERARRELQEHVALRQQTVSLRAQKETDDLSARHAAVVGDLQTQVETLRAQMVEGATRHAESLRACEDRVAQEMDLRWRGETENAELTRQLEAAKGSSDNNAALFHAKLNAMEASHALSLRSMETSADRRVREAEDRHERQMGAIRAELGESAARVASLQSALGEAHARADKAQSRAEEGAERHKAALADSRRDQAALAEAHSLAAALQSRIDALAPRQPTHTATQSDPTAPLSLSSWSTIHLPATTTHSASVQAAACIPCGECGGALAACSTLFPCGHSVCQDCTQRLKQRDRRLEGFTCRECGDGLPVTALVRNVALDRLLN